MVILDQNLMGDNQLENLSRRSFQPNDFKKKAFEGDCCERSTVVSDRLL